MIVVPSDRCRLSKLKPVRLVALAAAWAFAQSAYAQSAAESASDEKTQGTIVITANGSQVELPADYAGGQVARGGRIGLFGNLDMMVTPFNATNYTDQFIRDQQAESVAEIVQTDPAVRVARGFGNFQELYVVRGFPVYSDDMSYDGLYGLLPRQFVASEFLERVEVFRGANTFLNGAAPGGSGIGGEFNLVPKRAPEQDVNRVSAGYENSSQGFGAADISRRFGEDRDFGVRVNIAHHGGEDAIAGENLQLSMASLGADFRSEHARFSLDLGWQDHNINAPRPSVTPIGTSIPAPPDAKTNFAQPWTFSEEHDLLGVFRGEYDFNEDAKVWLATGFRHGVEHNVLANPNADAAGDTTAYRFDNFRRDMITTSEIGARFGFDTGFVKHKVSVTGSIFELNSKNSYALSNFLAGFDSSLYTPVVAPEPPADFFTGGQYYQPLTTSLTKTSSMAVADILSVADDRFLVILGAREQRIQAYSYDYDTGIESPGGYDRSALTPSVGLVYHPIQLVSFYANYIEGLVQGGTAPETTSAGGAVANAGQVLSPSKSKQYEVGAKYDQGNLSGSLAVFRITEPSAYLVGNFYANDGRQRNQGIELNAFGEPLKGLRILGGATYVDAKTLQSGTPSFADKKVIGVPEMMVNVGAEWDVSGLHGLTVDGRIVYTGSEWVDGANTLGVPAWTRVDLGARYGFTVQDKLLTVRFNVENVANKSYWASVGGAPGDDYLVLADPRTFRLSASVDL